LHHAVTLLQLLLLTERHTDTHIADAPCLLPGCDHCQAVTTAVAAAAAAAALLLHLMHPAQCTWLHAGSLIVPLMSGGGRLSMSRLASSSENVLQAQQDKQQQQQQEE
jgi:hypothetical protein